MANVNTFSTLHSEFQEPLYDPLRQNIQQGLRGEWEQFPGFEQVTPLYNQAATQQYFQSAFVDPAMRRLTGPYGTIPRVGARSAQRGTFFSSGRQHLEAEAASNTFGNLAGTYAGLVGQDQAATYQDWIRRQPQQITRQALNWLGTPMTVATEDDDPNPWMGALGGAASGAGTGAAIGTAVGGPGVGTAVGAGIGAVVGGGIGFFSS